MRWIALLLAIALPVRADWFQFRPCGFGHDIESPPGDMILAPEYVPAPSLQTVFWWIPRNSVIRIVELRARPGEKKCSWLAVHGDEWLVMGTAEELYEYIVTKRSEKLDQRLIK